MHIRIYIYISLVFRGHYLCNAACSMGRSSQGGVGTERSTYTPGLPYKISVFSDPDPGKS